MKLKIVFLLILLASSIGWSCTVFSAARNNMVLFGNNEDWTDTLSDIEFIPASGNLHGRFFFRDTADFPEGGMNDQGLVYDICATPQHQITNPQGKPFPTVDLFDKCLGSYATVAEFLTEFRKYDLSFMAKWQIVVADASGNSAILEGDSTILRQGDWQVCTNFLQSVTAKPFTDGRYRIVADEFAKGNPISMASFGASCSAARQGGSWPTVYSTVTDLKTRDIHLYVRSDFSRHVAFNLATELGKGARRLKVREFYKTFQAVGVKQSSSAAVPRSHPSTAALRFAPGPAHPSGIVISSCGKHYDVKGRTSSF